MNKKTKISTIIPTYNGKKLLKKNLPFVLDVLRHNDELIIVDDASNDKTIDYLTNKFNLRPSVKVQNNKKPLVSNYKYKKKSIKVILVTNQVNQRYAASVNLGVQFATNPVLFLLNNDVQPEHNCIEPALEYFEDKDTFAVSCLEINKDEQFGGKNKLWFEKGMFMHARADNFTAGETAWACGGSSFFDKQKWHSLNGFSLDYYPAYWEDIDLSFRAKKRQWKIYFDPRCTVNHLHETTNQTVFGQNKIADISWKNSITFLKKHANLWQKIAFYLWRPYWWYQRLNQQT